MLKVILKKLGVVIIVLIILLLFYLFTGSGKKNTQIDYSVKVDTDTNQLKIKMIIEPNRFLFLDLMIDFKIEKNDFRIRDFEITRDNKGLAHWKTIPTSNSLERLWIGFNRAPITVTYTVDPQVEVGSRGKMLGYLTDQYGYIRGRNILYRPINLIKFIVSKGQSENQVGVGSIQFDLPEGWQVNDPWVNNSEKIAIGDLQNTYWGLGRNIDIIRFKNISIGIIDKMDEDKQKTISQNIERIYSEIERLSGFQPKQYASYWTVSILPPVPIHGGASGNYSLLTDNNISTIAHEIFHWWNGFTLKNSKETKWIKEGFTKYYEGKLLLNTGIWSDAEFQNFIEKLIKELFQESNPHPINLIAISKNFTSNNSMEEYYKLYNGGALLAYYIDKKLVKEQRSLDEIWLLLYKLDKDISGEDFLNTLEEMTNETFRDEVNDMIYGKKCIPID